MESLDVIKTRAWRVRVLWTWDSPCDLDVDEEVHSSLLGPRGLTLPCIVFSFPFLR